MPLDWRLISSETLKPLDLDNLLQGVERHDCSTYRDEVSRLELEAGRWSLDPTTIGPEYPPVSKPEHVSDWERILYRVLNAAGLRPIPQYSVEQCDLDFAIVVGDRRHNVQVDGERYHRSWTAELCLRDQLRHQRLIELGWEVKRFWVYEVRDSLDECVATVRRWAEAAKGPA